MLNILRDLFLVLKPVLIYFAPDICFHTLFQEFDITNEYCLKVFISKVLGYGIIVGSCLVKLPQVIKLMSSKSGEGISVMGTLLELAAMTITSGYGYVSQFPISAYGDSISLSLQTALIGVLVLVYSHRYRQAATLGAVFVATVAYLFSPAVYKPLLIMLQVSNIPLAAGGKLTQAWQNYQQGSTGQLSAVSLILIFVGCLARIFTSIQETGDSLIILTFVITSFCNGLLVGQLYYYWNRTSTEGREGKKKSQ